MATATLSYNLKTLIGGNFDPRRTRVWVTANVPILVDGTQLRPDDWPTQSPASDGTGSFTLVTTNSAVNPTSFAYVFHVDYTLKGSRERRQWHSSEFPFTSSANIAAINAAFDGLGIPPNWRSDFRDEMEDIRDSTVGALTADVQAVAEDRAYIEARVVDDLGITDGQASALMATPSSLLAQETETKIAEVAAPRDPSTALLPARADLANRDAVPFNVLCLGDSITEGGNVTQQDRRWVDRLRANLRTLRPTPGADAGVDTSYIPAHDPSSLWNRMVWSGSTYTPGSYYGIGGRSMTMTGTAKATVTVNGSEIGLIGPTSGGLGVFSVKVDGGSATLLSAGSPGGDIQGEWRVNLGTTGSHTVEIAVDSGTVVLNGIMVYSDGDKDRGIRVLDGGHSGWRSTDFDPAGDLPKQIVGHNPQLGIIALMANDTYTTVTPVATYKARLIALGNLFRPAQPYTRSVLFLAYPQRGAAGASVWPDYVQAMKEAADEVNGGAAFIDLGERVPAYDSYGYPYFADTVHLTDATHGMVADAITDLLVR